MNIIIKLIIPSGRVNLTTAIFFFLIFLTVSRVSAYAKPSITSALGIFSNGESATILGSQFGTNSSVGTSNLQWLGANIESGPEGSQFSAPGWTSLAQDSESAGTFYDDAQAHSGSQSLNIDYLKEGSIYRYSGHFAYDRGLPMSKVYFTWWVRVHHAGGSWEGSQSGQWKIFRVQRGSKPSDGNMQPGFYIDVSPTQGNEAHNMPTIVNDQWTCDPPCESSPTTIYLGDQEVPGGIAAQQDKWMRMEIYVEESSVGVNNGTWQYWLHDPGVAIRNPQNYQGNLLVNGSPEHLKYIIFGHFAADGTNLHLSTWWDDVFIQVGTQARVEIGDNPIWENCTHREVQIPTAWSQGSIAITVNLGSFQKGETVYLFVVDANGNMNSQGYPITIGRYSAPKNLRVKEIK